MMQTTIGQRIAGRRKLQNLSQEALAEQLQVSRQAVSKWEADAAVPEIDKLIALSKIFGVRVGWLLGTESDPDFDPATGLSEAQLKMVEEIVHRGQPAPRRMSRARALLAVCIFVVLMVFGLQYQLRMDALSADNADALAQIADLAEDNRKLQEQIQNMNALLQEQAKNGKLLTQVQVIPYVSPDLNTVEVDFYCTPKALPENAVAYLSVVNAAARVHELLPCHLRGDSYYVRAILPPADGYQYSFLFVSDSGFQEQIIACEKYFTDLLSSTRFHGDPGNTRTVWPSEDRQYSFEGPVYTPIIPIAQYGYVGYKDVLISLKHNGEVIWKQSFRESLREHAGAYMVSEEPWYPQIQVQLPELAAGDTLSLEVDAQYYTGVSLTSVLETLTVEG